ncbi:MAG: hypothetical protein QOD92_1413 [Acidimicrobiaceae bacterium]|jgi:hypothetical protein
MKTGGIDQHDIDLVDDLTDHLALDEPMVRLDLIMAARARLADGRQPTALDLAGTLVAHFA